MNKLLVVGSPERLEELQARPQAELAITWSDELEPDPAGLAAYQACVHLNLDEIDLEIIPNCLHGGAPILGCAVKRPVQELLLSAGLNPRTAQVVGLNALPGFLDRNTWEVSLAGLCAQPEELKSLFQPVFQGFQVQPEWVQDRVGMVSARVLAMIINEAYWMLQEGAAAPQAIDDALRLGVNYPEGPLAWCERIGPQNVADILLALQEELDPATYKLAPALWQEARNTLS